MGCSCVACYDCLQGGMMDGSISQKLSSSDGLVSFPINPFVEATLCWQSLADDESTTTFFFKTWWLAVDYFFFTGEAFPVWNRLDYVDDSIQIIEFRETIIGLTLETFLCIIELGSCSSSDPFTAILPLPNTSQPIKSCHLATVDVKQANKKIIS